jgi:hypothetical protein
METIIGAIIVIFIMGVFLFIYLKTKDRKEHLNIIRINDTVHLLLTQDEYCDFDVSYIKDDEEKITTELKKVVKARATELVKFVHSVSCFDGSDKVLEQDLMKIIKSAILK